MPISTMRQPLDSRPAMTACFTISPEVRGSRPTTTVRPPMYVPKAWAKRVRRIGVSDSPITPRTPEMLIFKVGIGRTGSGSFSMLNTRGGQLHSPTTRLLGCDDDPDFYRVSPGPFERGVAPSNSVEFSV